MQKLTSYRPARAHLLTAGVILLTFVAGYLTPSSQDRARPTPTQQATATARATRTPLVTLAPTLTPVPVTLTATKVFTPTPSPDVTSTPSALDPCSHWHPYGPDLRYPSLGAFDMGVNPCDYLAVLANR